MDTRENRRPYSRGPYLSDVLEVKDVVEGEGADGAVQGGRLPVLVVPSRASLYTTLGDIDYMEGLG